MVRRVAWGFFLVTACGHKHGADGGGVDASVVISATSVETDAAPTAMSVHADAGKDAGKNVTVHAAGDAPLKPCPPNHERCDGVTCTNLATDHDHCGSCANDCTFAAMAVSGNATCIRGVCVTTCNPNEVKCNGKCTSPANFNDSDNCGRCNRKCPPPLQCGAGKCVRM